MLGGHRYFECVFVFEGDLGLECLGEMYCVIQNIDRRVVKVGCNDDVF